MPPSQSLAPELPARRDAAGVPVLFDSQCDRTIPDRLVCDRDLAGVPREIRRAMTPSERAEVEGRVVALRAALQPHGEEYRAAVEAEIAAMLSGFRSMRAQGEDAMAMVEITRAVLRDYPLWAIAKACALIAQGNAYAVGRRLDPRFAPNDAEIYAVVEDVVVRHRRALTQLAGLLEAKVRLPPPPRAERPAPAQSAPPERFEPGHHERVAADLAARRAQRESQQEP